MTRTPEEQTAYYNALEDRCKHFEQTIISATDLLRTILQDFETPVLSSILNPIIERIHSIVIFLEATADNAPSLNNHYSIEK
jgi:hypothetical protein